MADKKRQVRESEVVQAKRFVVEHENFIPPDIDDPRLKRPKDVWDFDDPDGISDATYTILPIIQEAGAPLGNISPPTDFWIVSQTGRSVPGGGTVIDVLIHIVDVPGAVEYEVRITKPAGQI